MAKIKFKEDSGYFAVTRCKDGFHNSCHVDVEDMYFYERVLRTLCGHKCPVEEESKALEALVKEMNEDENLGVKIHLKTEEIESKTRWTFHWEKA